jgi:hypothetical protein
MKHDMRPFAFLFNDSLMLLNVDLYDKELMKCTYLIRLMLPSQTERSEIKTRFIVCKPLIRVLLKFSSGRIFTKIIL